jgi:hypothetical protein
MISVSTTIIVIGAILAMIGVAVVIVLVLLGDVTVGRARLLERLKQGQNEPTDRA